MGQNSSSRSPPTETSGGTTLVVDASDSFVTNVKLRSTGIIPISEYIKKEKYHKNVQKLENAKSNNSSISDTVEIFKKETPSKQDTIVITRQKKGTSKKDDFIETSYEDIPERRQWVRNPKRHHYTKKIYNGESKSTKDIKNVEKTVEERKELRKNKKFNSTATQTPRDDEKSKNQEVVKELYKRNDFPAKKKSVKRTEEPRKSETRNLRRSTTKEVNNKCEESTHLFHTHQISPSGKPKNKNITHQLVVQTNLSCIVPPDKYLQMQSIASDNYFNSKTYPKRKYAGEYYNANEKVLNYRNNAEIKHSSSYGTNSGEHNGPKIENIAREHRRCLSAKQALENWKNIHTLKQHRKTIEKSTPNQTYCDTVSKETFDNSTQTIFYENKQKYVRFRGSPTMPTIPEKSVSTVKRNKDFMRDIEKCLQRHSHLCELNEKRNGGTKSTWVQDRFRKWHKVTFDNNTA